MLCASIACAEVAEVGPSKLYYVSSQPLMVLYRDEKLLVRPYIWEFHTQLGQCTRTDGEGEVLVTWSRDNSPRYTMNQTLTLSAGGYQLLSRFSFAPSDRAGREIGLFLPDAFLRGPGEKVTCTVKRGDAENTVTLTDDPVEQIVGADEILLEGPRHRVRIRFRHTGFEGSHGWHFQDHRQNQKSLGWWRIVYSFNKEHGAADAEAVIEVMVLE